MTNTELVRQLKTASIQADEMRLRDFGYLMKTASDAIPQWIPVTERLPEPNTEVLIFSGGFVDIGGCEKFYDFDSDEVVRWYVKEVGFSAEVTHWMPLPKPPKEVSK